MTNYEIESQKIETLLFWAIYLRAQEDDARKYLGRGRFSDSKWSSTISYCP